MNRICLLIVTLLLAQTVSANHLLGGYISTQSQPGQFLTQQVTVYLYLDEASGAVASIDLTSVNICFGDGNQQLVPRLRRTILGSDTGVSLNVYQTTYTYAGPGVYPLSIVLANRSETLNLPDGLLMGLKTTVNVRQANSTPILPVSPSSFRPALNQLLSYSMSATDADGDSLAYRLAIPLSGQGSNTVCNTTLGESGNFVFPNAVEQRGIFKINAQTGVLTWNAPTTVGAYVFAIVVEEWRKGQLIGQTQVEQVLAVRSSGGLPGVVPPYEPANTSPNGLITGLVNTDDELLTYPNPVIDWLTVRLINPQAKPVTLQLLTETGRILHERTTTQPSNALDLRAIPAGVYMLLLKTDTGQATRKIVRQ